jgi:hypothetical protein
MSNTAHPDKRRAERRDNDRRIALVPVSLDRRKDERRSHDRRVVTTSP